MQHVCAWCGRIMTPGPPEGGVSHGLCLSCLPTAFPCAVEDLPRLTAAELDALPYGAIRLDPEGRVMDYNAVESALSRQAPDAVIGRHFFREVAPCTAVRELEGWVDEARRAGLDAATRLRFVFRFPFGQELVTLALTWSARTGTTHILVNPVQRETTD